MSLRELTRRGIAKPEENWSELPQATKSERFTLLALLVGVVVSLGMMWFGGGRLVTFAGLVAFEFVLFSFLWSGYRATDRQNQKLLEMDLAGKVVGLETEPRSASSDEFETGM